MSENIGVNIWLEKWWESELSLEIENYREQLQGRVLYLIVDWEVREELSEVDNLIAWLEWIKREIMDVYIVILTTIIKYNTNIWLILNFNEPWENTTPYVVTIDGQLEVWELVDFSNSYLKENITQNH